jgi:hypothetical protein
MQAVLATQPQTSAHIVDRRATCAGIAYTVEDSIGIHTVTVNNGCTGCTCGLDRYFVHCSHRQIVERQEQFYEEEALLRSLFVSEFGIYN